MDAKAIYENSDRRLRIDKKLGNALLRSHNAARSFVIVPAFDGRPALAKWVKPPTPVSPDHIRPQRAHRISDQKEPARDALDSAQPVTCQPPSHEPAAPRTPLADYISAFLRDSQRHWRPTNTSQSSTTDILAEALRSGKEEEVVSKQVSKLSPSQQKELIHRLNDMGVIKAEEARKRAEQQNFFPVERHVLPQAQVENAIQRLLGYQKVRDENRAHRERLLRISREGNQSSHPVCWEGLLKRLYHDELNKMKERQPKVLKAKQKLSRALNGELRTPTPPQKPVRKRADVKFIDRLSQAQQVKLLRKQLHQSALVIQSFWRACRLRDSFRHEWEMHFSSREPLLQIKNSAEAQDENQREPIPNVQQPSAGCDFPSQSGDIVVEDVEDFGPSPSVGHTSTSTSSSPIPNFSCPEAASLTPAIPVQVASSCTVKDCSVPPAQAADAVATNQLPVPPMHLGFGLIPVSPNMLVPFPEGGHSWLHWINSFTPSNRSSDTSMSTVPSVTSTPVPLPPRPCAARHHQFLPSPELSQASARAGPPKSVQLMSSNASLDPAENLSNAIVRPSLPRPTAHSDFLTHNGGTLQTDPAPELDEMLEEMVSTHRSLTSARMMSARGLPTNEAVFSHPQSSPPVRPLSEQANIGLSATVMPSPTSTSSSPVFLASASPTTAMAVPSAQSAQELRRTSGPPIPPLRLLASAPTKTPALPSYAPPPFEWMPVDVIRTSRCRMSAIKRSTVVVVSIVQGTLGIEPAEFAVRQMEPVSGADGSAQILPPDLPGAEVEHCSLLTEDQERLACVTFSPMDANSGEKPMPSSSPLLDEVGSPAMPYPDENAATSTSTTTQSDTDFRRLYKEFLSKGRKNLRGRELHQWERAARMRFEEAQRVNDLHMGRSSTSVAGWLRRALSPDGNPLSTSEILPHQAPPSMDFSPSRSSTGIRTAVSPNRQVKRQMRRRKTLKCSKHELSQQLVDIEEEAAELEMRAQRLQLLERKRAAAEEQHRLNVLRERKQKEMERWEKEQALQEREANEKLEAERRERKRAWKVRLETERHAFEEEEVEARFRLINQQFENRREITLWFTESLEDIRLQEKCRKESEEREAKLLAQLQKEQEEHQLRQELLRFERDARTLALLESDCRQDILSAESTAWPSLIRVFTEERNCLLSTVSRAKRAPITSEIPAEISVTSPVPPGQPLTPWICYSPGDLSMTAPSSIQGNMSHLSNFGLQVSGTVSPARFSPQKDSKKAHRKRKVHSRSRSPRHTTSSGTKGSKPMVSQSSQAVEMPRNDSSSNSVIQQVGEATSCEPSVDQSYSATVSATPSGRRPTIPIYFGFPPPQQAVVATSYDVVIPSIPPSFQPPVCSNEERSQFSIVEPAQTPRPANLQNGAQTRSMEPTALQTFNAVTTIEMASPQLVSGANPSAELLKFPSQSSLLAMCEKPNQHRKGSLGVITAFAHDAPISALPVAHASMPAPLASPVLATAPFVALASELMGSENASHQKRDVVVPSIPPPITSATAPLDEPAPRPLPSTNSFVVSQMTPLQTPRPTAVAVVRDIEHPSNEPELHKVSTVGRIQINHPTVHLESGSPSSAFRPIAPNNLSNPSADCAIPSIPALPSFTREALVSMPNPPATVMPAAPAPCIQQPTRLIQEIVQQNVDHPSDEPELRKVGTLGHIRLIPQPFQTSTESVIIPQQTSAQHGDAFPSAMPLNSLSGPSRVLVSSGNVPPIPFGEAPTPKHNSDEKPLGTRSQSFHMKQIPVASLNDSEISGPFTSKTPPHCTPRQPIWQGQQPSVTAIEITGRFGLKMGDAPAILHADVPPLPAGNQPRVSTPTHRKGSVSDEKASVVQPIPNRMNNLPDVAFTQLPVKSSPTTAAPKPPAPEVNKPAPGIPTVRLVVLEANGTNIPRGEELQVKTTFAGFEYLTEGDDADNSNPFWNAEYVLNALESCSTDTPLIFELLHSKHAIATCRFNPFMVRQNHTVDIHLPMKPGPNHANITVKLHLLVTLLSSRLSSALRIQTVFRMHAVRKRAKQSKALKEGKSATTASSEPKPEKPAEPQVQALPQPPDSSARRPSLTQLKASDSPVQPGMETSSSPTKDQKGSQLPPRPPTRPVPPPLQTASSFDEKSSNFTPIKTTPVARAPTPPAEWQGKALEDKVQQAMEEKRKSRPPTPVASGRSDGGARPTTPLPTTLKIDTNDFFAQIRKDLETKQKAKDKAMGVEDKTSSASSVLQMAFSPTLGVARDFKIPIPRIETPATVEEIIDDSDVPLDTQRQAIKNKIEAKRQRMQEKRGVSPSPVLPLEASARRRSVSQQVPRPEPDHTLLKPPSPTSNASRGSTDSRRRSLSAPPEKKPEVQQPAPPISQSQKRSDSSSSELSTPSSGQSDDDRARSPPDNFVKSPLDNRSSDWGLSPQRRERGYDRDRDRDRDYDRDRGRAYGDRPRSRSRDYGKNERGDWERSGHFEMGGKKQRYYWEESSMDMSRRSPSPNYSRGDRRSSTSRDKSYGSRYDDRGDRDRRSGKSSRSDSRSDEDDWSNDEDYQEKRRKDYRGGKGSQLSPSIKTPPDSRFTAQRRSSDADRRKEDLESAENELKAMRDRIREKMAKVSR